MNENPYEAPKVDQEKVDNIEVPPEIKKKIKNAWIAGLVSISLTVVVVLISISGTSIMGINYTGFVDVILMSVFVFGIYKNSRVCAILMLLLFLANKILMIIESGKASGIVLALVFLWYYFQGVVGTFQYHAYIKNSLNKSIQPVADAPTD